MSFFYRPQTIILTINIILTITHNFNASKKAYPPKVQNLSEDELLLSKICFLCLERAKIPLKSNKKRRIGTNNCILFCVLIWCGCRSLRKQLITVFRARSEARAEDLPSLRSGKQKPSLSTRSLFTCERVTKRIQKYKRVN